MKIIVFFSVFSLLLLNGCQDLAVKDNIIGNYYLVAADKIEGTCLSYHESDDLNYSCLIEAAVFGVGFDERYMIVEQHPWKFESPLNRNITNYFILPLKKGMNWRSKNGLIGPLTLEEFKEIRKELNIPENLKFTKEIDYIK